MDREEKRAQVSRYLAGAKKIRSRDEQRLINENSKARKQGRKQRSPRQRDWDEDEGEDLFEAMRPGGQVDLSGAKPSALPDLSGRHLGLDRGLMISPHGARATVLAGGAVVDVEVQDDLRTSGALAVGDEVFLEGMRVVGREERRSVLSRRDPGAAHQEKVIAANVDVGVIVLPAGGRNLKVGLVDRLWIALARGGIEPLVAINKVDLCEAAGQAEELARVLAAWQDLGLAAVSTSAVDGAGVEDLRAALAGRTAVFVGQSGVGKSSLLNRLDPDGARLVEAIRDADGRGRHTTTASTLRELGDGTRLIDTPGVRAFGLPTVEPVDVLAAFPDLELLAESCRFRDCRHGAEAGCAVALAAAQDEALSRRLEAFRRILASVEADC